MDSDTPWQMGHHTASPRAQRPCWRRRYRPSTLWRSAHLRRYGTCTDLGHARVDLRRAPATHPAPDDSSSRWDPSVEIGRASCRESVSVVACYLLVNMDIMSDEWMIASYSSE